jgi:hypothetical protein
LHVAQQGVGQAEFFGPGKVGIIKIDTDTQNLGARGFKLGKIKLESQCFLGSKFGEGADVEKQHHRLLTQIVVQFDFLPGRTGKLKRRGFIADLQGEPLTRAKREQHAPDKQGNRELPPPIGHTSLLLCIMN